MEASSSDSGKQENSPQITPLGLLYIICNMKKRELLGKFLFCISSCRHFGGSMNGLSQNGKSDRRGGYQPPVQRNESLEKLDEFDICSDSSNFFRYFCVAAGRLIASPTFSRGLLRQRLQAVDKPVQQRFALHGEIVKRGW